MQFASAVFTVHLSGFSHMLVNFCELTCLDFAGYNLCVDE